MHKDELVLNISQEIKNKVSRYFGSFKTTHVRELKKEVSKRALTLLLRFDPIPGHGLHLPGSTITIRHTTVSRTPLDE
jgi:hypothetical protein